MCGKARLDCDITFPLCWHFFLPPRPAGRAGGHSGDGACAGSRPPPASLGRSSAAGPSDTKIMQEDTPNRFHFVRRKKNSDRCTKNCPLTHRACKDGEQAHISACPLPPLRTHPFCNTSQPSTPPLVLEHRGCFGKGGEHTMSALIAIIDSHPRMQIPSILSFNYKQLFLMGGDCLVHDRSF